MQYQAGDNEAVRVYESLVARFAGDPKPFRSRVLAVNRRHAEALLAAKHPGMRVDSADRIS